LTVLVFLTSHESFGMMGVAIAMSLQVMLITFLHLGTLYKKLHFKIRLLDLIKMSSLIIISWQIGLFFKHKFLAVLSLDRLVLTISLLTCIYIVLLFVLRFITKDELKQFPFFNKLLS